MKLSLAPPEQPKLQIMITGYHLIDFIVSQLFLKSFCGHHWYLIWSETHCDIKRKMANTIRVFEEEDSSSTCCWLRKCKKNYLDMVKSDLRTDGRWFRSLRLTRDCQQISLLPIQKPGKTAKTTSKPKIYCDHCMLSTMLKIDDYCRSEEEEIGRNIQYMKTKNVKGLFLWVKDWG